MLNNKEANCNLTVADFSITHFNGANRTYDRESTDATAIHPLSKRCENFLKNIANQENLTTQNGVVLLSGLGSAIIDKLINSGFTEHTIFIDEVIGQT